MLARMHRITGPRHGWHRDNYIGTMPQKNAWSDDWISFYRDCRLRPQLERANIDAEFLLAGMGSLLANHRPEPSLLHGDLWNGNAGFTADGPVIFDPAVYYGDRETDMAMTELFGGFPAAFYSSYAALFPLAPGYEVRKHLYNLYHLLNHLNLFGTGYLLQVNVALGLLRDVL